MFDFISSIFNEPSEEIDPLHEKLMDVTCKIIETDTIVMKEYIEHLENRIRGMQRMSTNDQRIRAIFFLENCLKGKNYEQNMWFLINRQNSDKLNFQIPRELPMVYSIGVNREKIKTGSDRVTWVYRIKNYQTEKKITLKISSEKKKNFNNIIFQLQDSILNGLF